MSDMRIIWINSYQNLLFPLIDLFKGKNFKVEYSNNISLVRRDESAPDLIISDIARGDTLLTLKNLGLPFLIVSECHELEVIQRAFECGALDYIIYPGFTSEIIAKVDFALLKKRVVVVPPKIENLTQKESLLFNLFFNNLEKELSRETIVADIWGGLVIYRKSLDVHLHHLRKKLKDHNFVIHYGENNRWKMSRVVQ